MRLDEMTISELYAQKREIERQIEQTENKDNKKFLTEVRLTQIVRAIDNIVSKRK